MSDLVFNSTLSSSSKTEYAKDTFQYSVQQEVKDLLEILKVDYKKYIQFKILEDIVEKIINESEELGVDLKCKINDILLNSRCSQLMDLEDGYMEKSISLLGIEEPDTELNYSEKNMLQNLVERKLMEKCVELDLKNKIDSKSDKYISTFDLSEDKALIDMKKKLCAEQKIYVQNLYKLMSLLEDIINLRISKLPGIIKQKDTENNVFCKMNHFKSELLQKKVEIDIFMESSKSLDAYRQFIKDLKKQQEDCRREIEDLTELKEKYKAVSCAQYEVILKSYLQYKSSIEKKEQMYNCLNSCSR